MRTFFAEDDRSIPTGLRTNAVRLPSGGVLSTVRASDGATWQLFGDVQSGSGT